jgi:hypothetical protein
MPSHFFHWPTCKQITLKLEEENSNLSNCKFVDRSLEMYAKAGWVLETPLAVLIMVRCLITKELIMFKLDFFGPSCNLS